MWSQMYISIQRLLFNSFLFKERCGQYKSNYTLQMNFQVTFVQDEIYQEFSIPKATHYLLASKEKIKIDKQGFFHVKWQNY